MNAEARKMLELCRRELGATTPREDALLIASFELTLRSVNVLLKEIARLETHLAELEKK